MSLQITIRIPERDLALLDEAIARGRFGNRTQAMRQALERLLREERDREIEDAYRRGYGASPQEDWIGDAGLAAFAALVAAEEGAADPL